MVNKFLSIRLPHTPSGRRVLQNQLFLKVLIREWGSQMHRLDLLSSQLSLIPPCTAAGQRFPAPHRLDPISGTDKHKGMFSASRLFCDSSHLEASCCLASRGAGILSRMVQSRQAERGGQGGDDKKSHVQI